MASGAPPKYGPTQSLFPKNIRLTDDDYEIECTVDKIEWVVFRLVRIDGPGVAVCRMANAAFELARGNSDLRANGVADDCVDQLVRARRRASELVEQRGGARVGRDDGDVDCRGQRGASAGQFV